MGWMGPAPAIRVRCGWWPDDFANRGQWHGYAFDPSQRCTSFPEETISANLGVVGQFDVEAALRRHLAR